MRPPSDLKASRKSLLAVADIATPPGAEGWRDMYPKHLLFQEKTDGWEHSAFWFQDSLHHPRPMLPFETIVSDAIRIGFGEINHQIFCIPLAYGIEHRMINGYVYFSGMQPNLNDAGNIKKRQEDFAERSQFYYQNWDRLWQNWQAKVTGVIDRMERLEIPVLGDRTPLEYVTSGSGLGLSYRLLNSYDQAVQMFFEVWQYHFEMLNLGYSAFLEFRQLTNALFPDLTEYDVGQFFSGASQTLMQPRVELQRLARQAMELGLAEQLLGSPNWSAAQNRLKESASGRSWLAAWHETERPWFFFSTGTGFYSGDQTWIDSPDIPFGHVCEAIRQIEAGTLIELKRATLIAEREARFAAYRARITDAESGEQFEKTYRLALKVAPYLEDHNFYVEHWFQTCFWRLIRRFGARLCERGFLTDADDIFYFNRWEASQLLFDATASWTTGATSPNIAHWRATVAERRRIFEVLRAWSAPPAIGEPPERITDPCLPILWGIDKALLDRWSADETERKLDGIPASPGKVTGRAFIARDPSDLAQLEPGDVLICRTMAPAWNAAFGRVAGVVTEIGGVLSHGAIVCREYGIPAVVSVISATTDLTTGMHVEIDGTRGIVRIAERASPVHPV